MVQGKGRQQKRQGASANNSEPSPNGKAPRKPRRAKHQDKHQANASNGEQSGEARRKAAYGSAERERLAAAPTEEVAELEVLTASAGRIERTEWLWKDRLEWGSVSIMQGAKGAGKST